MDSVSARKRRDDDVPAVRTEPGKGDRKTYPRRAPDLRRPTYGALAPVGVPRLFPQSPFP
jgi:hypothetical protein